MLGISTAFQVARGEKQLRAIKSLTEKGNALTSYQLVYETIYGDSADEHLAYLYGANISCVTGEGTVRRTVWLDRSVGRRRDDAPFEIHKT